MNKLYDRIIWVNDTSPALNEDNLNAMSKAIDDIDDRVLDLGGAVLDVIPDLEELRDHAEQIIEDTKDYAIAAGNSASAANNSAKDAESWAVGERGGTPVPGTDPAYENNAKYYAETVAEGKVEDAEAWAVGERDGVPVPSTDPAYHNNSKYWSQQANPTTLASLTDTDINTPSNGQVLMYDSIAGKWKNSNTSGGAASTTSYDNTSSGMTATNVQSAIDEIYKPTFSQAATRANIGTGESVPTLFGKVEKWFNDISYGVMTGSRISTASGQGWVQDTTAQSGTTLYRQYINLTHLYIDTPIVSLAPTLGNILPTVAEQEAYDLLQYVTVNPVGPTLVLYASDIPQVDFVLEVIGADLI